MKHYITRSIFSLLSAALLFFSISTVSSYSLSCLPTCSSVDGRFITISEGAGFSTFTPGTLNVRLRIPAGSDSFSLGIFDGDGHHIDPGTLGFWDAGVEDSPYSYTLKIDPDGDNLGAPVFEVLSGDLPSNDWADFTFPVHELAMDENGDFLYVLTINHLNDDPTSNRIKLRSSGTLFINEIFSFSVNWSSISDIGIVFPNFDFSDGTGPEDAIGANYDGTLSFFFEIPEGAGEISELVLWDADCDHGNYDGTDWDTDDPNTPNNTIPPFVPMGSNVLFEGANTPSPFDDSNPNIQFGSLLSFPPAVIYKVIFPDGQEFVNDNPSGNREWEKFSITTFTDNPQITDAVTQSIPPGLYEVRFEGLDINNLCAINPPLPFTLFGEVIPDEEIPPTAVPTMSEWGLIALAVVMAIIGIFTVRRRQQVS